MRQFSEKTIIECENRGGGDNYPTPRNVDGKNFVFLEDIIQCDDDEAEAEISRGPMLDNENKGRGRGPDSIHVGNIWLVLPSPDVAYPSRTK